MKSKLFRTKEILDLESKLKTKLEVKERPKYLKLPQYYASFKKAELSEGGMLVSIFGNGNTIDEAISDYVRQIECRKIVFKAYKKNRKEIILPKLVHTKFVGK